jgi:endonuclease/exonuclease/phosphatase family metal-dependent hydrolase
LPVIATRRIDLTFGSREPRGALDVELDAYGTRVRVVATHLGLRPGERRAQVRRILQAVAADDNGLTVLLGDINEWLMIGRPLRWLHARFGHCRGKPSYPARFPLLALDRIWVHPRTSLTRFDVRNDAEARRASDHLPVTAELCLDARSAAEHDDDADVQEIERQSACFSGCSRM